MTSNAAIYEHDAIFNGIYVTRLCQLIKVEGGYVALLPNSFFAEWILQPEHNRGISPLKYILSAN